MHTGSLGTGDGDGESGNGIDSDNYDDDGDGDGVSGSSIDSNDDDNDGDDCGVFKTILLIHLRCFSPSIFLTSTKQT